MDIILKIKEELNVEKWQVEAAVKLIDEGNTVDIATNEEEIKVPDCYRDWNCAVYQIDTSRSPFNKGNINAIRQMKRLVEKEKYDIVLLDPPYGAGLLEKALEQLVAFDILRQHGIIVCESGAEQELPEVAEPYFLYRTYRYGKIKLTIYHRRGEEEA